MNHSKLAQLSNPPPDASDPTEHPSFAAATADRLVRWFRAVAAISCLLAVPACGSSSVAPSGTGDQAGAAGLGSTSDSDGSGGRTTGTAGGSGENSGSSGEAGSTDGGGEAGAASSAAGNGTAGEQEAATAGGASSAWFGSGQCSGFAIDRTPFTQRALPQANVKAAIADVSVSGQTITLSGFSFGPYQNWSCSQVTFVATIQGNQFAPPTTACAVPAGADLGPMALTFAAGLLPGTPSELLGSLVIESGVPDENGELKQNQSGTFYTFSCALRFFH